MSSARDPRADARLVELYPRALSFARKCYPWLPPADHEDMVQEAVAKVLARLERGPLDEPGPYLMRVVFTTAAQMIRRRLAHDVISLDAEHDVHRGADRSLSPPQPEERAIARLETEAALKLLTERLTVEERRTLFLRSFLGLTPPEVAAALGTSVRRYRRLLESAQRKVAAAADAPG